MAKLPYSGKTTAYQHKHEPWQEGDITNVSAALVKRWVLDVQWSKCPVEVENQVKDIWRLYELGNDNYIHKTTIKDLVELQEQGTMVEQWHEKPDDISYEQAAKLKKDGQKIWGWIEGPIKTDYIVQYLREMGVGDDEVVWIHWWW